MGQGLADARGGLGATGRGAGGDRLQGLPDAALEDCASVHN
jgi:hypothetical protein